MYATWIFMAESKRIRVYYEGDDDRVILDEFKKAGGLLPENWDIVQRSKKDGGKEGMVHELAAFIRPVNGVGGDAVALLDLDDLELHQVGPWAESALAKELPPGDSNTTILRPPIADPRLSLIELSSGERKGRAVFVSVGLPEEEELRTVYQVERFAVDDYLFRLVRDPRAYEAMPDLREVAHELAMQKLMEFAKTLRNNQIPIRNCKRFLHLLRAVTGFRPSSAAIVERLVGKALEGLGKEYVRRLFLPLIDDPDEAARILGV
jgi:hypothetical protein